MEDHPLRKRLLWENIRSLLRMEAGARSGIISGWYGGDFRVWEAENIREKHLRFYTDNEYGRRSRDYRARFFRENPPLPGGFYFCAYCGIPHGRRRITVDHLYPVAKVSKDPALQKKLRRRGISDLNGPANLVPACHRCNAKKAAQMGVWIRKGRIGRHQWFWLFRWLVRCTVVFGLCYLCYRYL